jgi:hypothetical protein
MSTAHESSNNFDLHASQAEMSLSDYMTANYDHDPEWFVEPEDTPEYGPPGMPTPLVPMDARIAERQMTISNSLRSLLQDPRLRDFIGQDTIDMLVMNFDSHNAILGVANNGSYYHWKQQNHVPLPSELQAIEEKAVLGLATDGEILDLMLHHDDSDETVSDLKSAELFKIYHLAKFRMRHLEPRRDSLRDAIVARGGEISDDAEYYGLKLFPYVVVTNRELTVDEHRECQLLVTSAEKKMKLLTSGKTDQNLMSPELFDAITEEIKRDSYRVSEIMAGTQVHTIRGLMASVKRRVGQIQKTDEHDVCIVERQVFAVDVSCFDAELIEALHHVRALRDKQEDADADGRKANKSVMIDQATVAIYERVYADFKAGEDVVIPVSTAAFAHEKRRNDPHTETVTRAIARVALCADAPIMQ